MRYSNPLDLHPVALHFPLVRFVIPHFGAGLLREALMLADLCPNVFFDTSSSNRWMIYEGVDLASVFRRSIDVLGITRLLFGSDSSFFPRGWHPSILDQQSKALYELGLDAQQASQILCTNLEQFHEPRLRHLSQLAHVRQSLCPEVARVILSSDVRNILTQILVSGEALYCNADWLK